MLYAGGVSCDNEGNAVHRFKLLVVLVAIYRQASVGVLSWFNQRTSVALLTIIVSAWHYSSLPVGAEGGTW